MKPRAAAGLFAIALALSSCDDISDVTSELADKIHAVSPSRSYVAYVTNGADSTEVNVSFHQNGADRHVAARERFGKQKHIRFNIPVFDGKEATGASEAGLNFVGNE